MPNRPPRKPKKKTRRVPGCEVLKADVAEGFLQNQLLLPTMQEKRERGLQDAEGRETVMVSIGQPVRYNKTNYLAHVYCIDNFEDPEKNGWLVHLWHPNLVWGKHKTYRSYMAQMSDELGIDLWKVGV